MTGRSARRRIRKRTPETLPCAASDPKVTGTEIGAGVVGGAVVTGGSVGAGVVGAAVGAAVGASVGAAVGAAVFVSVPDDRPHAANNRSDRQRSAATRIRLRIRKSPFVIMSRKG